MTFPGVMQKYSYDCGPACAKAVAEWFSVGEPAVTCSTKLGASTHAICNGLEAVGLTTQNGVMDWRDLKYHLGRKRLVIALTLDATGLDGHYVVAHAIRGNKVSIHDPSTGPRTESLTEFTRKWSKKGRYGVAVSRD